MLKDITLGQYFPGETPVHRLDPRTKLLLTVVYIAALFTAKGVASYAVMFAALAGSVWLARIQPKALLKGLKPVIIIIVLTALLNLFLTDGDPIFRWKFIQITVQGVQTAIFMVIRIIMLIAGLSLIHI